MSTKITSSKKTASKKTATSGLNLDVGFTPDQLKIIEAMMQGKLTKLPTIKGKSDLVSTATLTEFKGNPMLSIIRGEASFINKPFSFGVAKAKLIVEHYEAIKRLAESK